MEDDGFPSPAPPYSSSSTDDSIADLIETLEKKVTSEMDNLLDQLQSLQREGKLDQTTFKRGTQQVSNFAQACLIMRTLPPLLTPQTMNDSLQTAELYTKLNQVAENLKSLCEDQARQIIATKASKILSQIQVKEQTIRDQISQKQQILSKIVQDKIQASPLG